MTILDILLMQRVLLRELPKSKKSLYIWKQYVNFLISIIMQSLRKMLKHTL